MCELFWKCGFSIEQCLLAIEKKNYEKMFIDKFFFPHD